MNDRNELRVFTKNTTTNNNNWIKTHPMQTTLYDWLMTYTYRLESKIYKIEKSGLGNPQLDYISLYCKNAESPLVYKRITHGIEVTASPIYLPQLSNLEQGDIYSYQIGLKMLRNKRPDSLKSIKLKSRHWRIQDIEGGEIDAIDGDGVIGLYPTLEPLNDNDESFIYSSYCARHLPSTFGGYMIFNVINGYLPDGISEGINNNGQHQIKIHLPEMILQRPEYIY